MVLPNAKGLKGFTDTNMGFTKCVRMKSIASYGAHDTYVQSNTSKLGRSFDIVSRKRI